MAEKDPRQRNEWIDPAAARQLMLEYQKVLGLKGGTEIARRIEEHAKIDFHRKTLENWLKDRGPPSGLTVSVVLQFLKTAHFQEMVPRTRDYLASDERLHRIGSALFDLHGPVGKDTAELEKLTALIAGWWTLRPYTGPHEPLHSFIHIEPVSDHPFAKMCLYLRSAAAYPAHPPRGSGIVLPKLGRKWRQRKGFPPPPELPPGASAEFPNLESRDTDFA